MIKETKISFIYDNRIYSKREWFGITSAFSRFNEEEIKSKYLHHLSISYLYEIYLRNVRKHTFLGLILPCIVFFLLGVIICCAMIFTYYGRFFIININQQIFILFLCICSFSFAVGLLYKVFILRQKCIYIKNRNSQGYKHISFKQYMKNKRIFKMHIIKNYIHFKPIKTKRTVIREFQFFDAQDYYQFAANKNVCKYLIREKITSLDEAKKIIKMITHQYNQGLIYQLAIEDIDDQKVIGYIGLSQYDLSPTTCQIVYALNEQYWGKGYASESVAAFIQYLKSQGKQVIIAGHVEENINSGKVLLKNGFIRDPSRDTQMVIHGEIKKIINYTIDERNKKT